MIDLGWTELFLLAVILIVVVGPKDLPGVLRGLGRALRKIRGLADEFKSGVDEFIRESDLQDVGKDVERMRSFNLQQLKAEIERKKTAAAPGAGAGETGPDTHVETPQTQPAATEPGGDAAAAEAKTAPSPAVPPGADAVGEERAIAADGDDKKDQ